MYQLCLFSRDGYTLGLRVFWSLREAAEDARRASREVYVRQCGIYRDGIMYPGRYRGGRYIAGRAPATY